MHVSDPRPPKAWTRRLAWFMAVWAAILLVAGGLVTTYRVGMAVPDWPTTFGYSMFRYPLDEMLDNFGVGIEHTHRLIAAVAGLGALVLLAATVLLRERRSLVWLAGALLAAIVAQGVIGGTRVLENSPGLAFLHGAFAQGVYALIAAFWIVTSPRWHAAVARPCKTSRGLMCAGALALAAVSLQIVIGAWLRHSGDGGALALHLILALAAIGAVLSLAARLGSAHAAGVEGGHDRSALLAVRRWLVVTLAAQVVLGFVATFAILVLSGGFDRRPVLLEVVAATAHVACGALLLSGTVAAVLFARRLVPAAGSAAVAPRRLEAAR